MIEHDGKKALRTTHRLSYFHGDHERNRLTPIILSSFQECVNLPGPCKSQVLPLKLWARPDRATDSFRA